MNNRSNIPEEVAAVYDRNLLDRAVAFFPHLKFAQIRDIKEHAGTFTINFRRYSNLAAATTALTEGITPSGKSLVVTKVEATVLQYGDFVTVTDVVQFSSVDSVLLETSDILGDQVSDTLDQLARDKFHAGTSKYFAGSGHTLRSQVAAGELITDVLIKKVVRLLKNNKAKFITRMVNPSNNYATTPLKAAFIGICDPSTTYDLEAITCWTGIEKYANKSDIMEGEVGSFGQVRFIESTNSKIFVGEGNGIDVHSTIIFGQNAFGISRITGQTLKNIIKPLGSGGTSDPLDQRATSGWKLTFVALILNNDYVSRIEHAVSA